MKEPALSVPEVYCLQRRVAGSVEVAATEVINQQLQLVYDWIVSNKMQLNFRKSKSDMVLYIIEKTCEVVVNDKVLEVVDILSYILD